MRNELQLIVDSLAARLGRAVDVEDRRYRVLAYSRHEAETDPVRVASILQREAPADVRSYLDSTNLAQTVEPTRVSPPDGLGMSGRLCAPIRWQETLLGYLWLIEGDDELGDDDVAAVVDAADAAAVVLYREQSLGQLAGRRERVLLRQLLDRDDPRRLEAAEELVASEVLAEAKSVAVIVATLDHDVPESLAKAVRVSLASALEGVRRDAMPGSAAWLLQPDHGALVVSLRPGAEPDDALRLLAEQLAARVEQVLEHARGWRVHVGVGGPVGALGDAGASYRQALTAARVAQRLGCGGADVALWTELGPYQLLSGLPTGQVKSIDDLPPAVVALLRHTGGDVLADTVEAYLDNAGDAKATASQLHLHRSSLYYRLHKVETVTGTDLRRGGDRLLLHMGIKLARLAGLRPEPRTEPLRSAS